MLQKIKNALMGTWERIKKTFWLFIGFLASQAVIQVMNFIAGIVILRSLPKEDYAAYTIMNTIVPVMLMLSDTGIGTGIFAIGRLIWEDNQKTGELINTGLQLRRKFALISFSLVGPFLAWMLFRNHVSIITIILLVINSLVFISFQLTGTVMKAILTLRQQFKLQIQTGIGITLLRFTLIMAFAYLFYINAVLAVFATTLSIVVETLIVTRAVKPQVVWDAPTNPEYRTQMFGLVKQTLPLTVYFCIQGQMSIWLLGIFGSAHQVADIGAAGRLGLIFTTISSAFSAIMVTQFAKANGRRKLFVMSIEIVTCLALMLGSVVAFAWFLPAPFLWLLGSKYNNMADLIWLVVLSSGVSSLAGSIFGLNTCKGWIPPAAVTIPIEVVTQVLLISCLDVSKIKSVLILTTLAAIPPTIVNAFMLARRIRQEPE